jgi:hypothetical protein
LDHEAFEVLCLLGRGIEQVRMGSQMVWRPTRYVERVTPEGRHTGFRHPSASANDDASLVAGSNAIVVAGHQLLQETNGFVARRLVIFAAGRPLYLEGSSPPGLTEGQVMLERLRRCRDGMSFEHLILASNKNTRDDMRETCRTADLRGLTRVRAVTVSVHVARTLEFAREACREFPGVSVRVEGAEDILSRRYSGRRGVAAMISAARNSPAQSRTLEWELRGLEALRAGSYGR